ncbi:MAG: hypothetical protein ACREFX_14530 [Opitutaceae bacterium]
MEDFAASLAAWARPRDDIEALVLIGSRQRSAGDGLKGADRHSDWDFHIIARIPGRFADREWLREIPGAEPLAYSVRRAAIGGVPRVTALFRGAEVDLVIVPAEGLGSVAEAAKAGQHLSSPQVRQSCQDLAVVIRPGWRFLKPNPKWEAWYAEVVNLVPDPRLGDAEVIDLAEAFVCHWVWARRKAARGEWRAAQRALHRELAETNYRLLHEIKLRAGQPSFPEARRIERVASEEELGAVSVDGGWRESELQDSLARTAYGFRTLVAKLVGERWRWPALDEG